MGMAMEIVFAHMEMCILIATGFTGALTLRFLWTLLVRLFVTPPSSGVHFSPKGGCTEAVVAELSKARREVLVLAYGFTSRPITDALVAATRRGVKVEIILDHSNEKEEHTDLPYLLQQGLKPLIDQNHAIAHNKIMLIDRRTVITGSFNFTNQAEKENAENLLILRHHAELAERYRHNFLDHKDHAREASLVAHQAGSHPAPGGVSRASCGRSSLRWRYAGGSRFGYRPSNASNSRISSLTSSAEPTWSGIDSMNRMASSQ